MCIPVKALTTKLKILVTKMMRQNHLRFESKKRIISTNASEKFFNFLDLFRWRVHVLQFARSPEEAVQSLQWEFGIKVFWAVCSDPILEQILGRCGTSVTQCVSAIQVDEDKWENILKIIKLNRTRKSSRKSSSSFSCCSKQPRVCSIKEHCFSYVESSFNEFNCPLNSACFSS